MLHQLQSLFQPYSNAYRRPLGESSSAGNRGKRSVEPAIKRAGKRVGRPWKRRRTDSDPSSSITSSQASSDPPEITPPGPAAERQQNASQPSTPPSPQREPLQQSTPPSEPSQDPPEWDIPDDFFQDFEDFDNSPSRPSTPYSGPPQPPARLQSFIARHPYTAEPPRHHLGSMSQICPRCGAASWKDETPEWCCDKGKTEVAAPESEEIEEEYNRHETGPNDEFNEDLDAINKILYSTREGSTELTRDCQEYRRYSVQYNNAASMASQQVTINHSVAPFTCKVQGAITTHMPALAPQDGEKSVFGQIYIMDNTQDQSITRYELPSMMKSVLNRSGTATMRIPAKIFTAKWPVI